MDKIKPVFIYCRFNISRIRKTVFVKTEIFFASFQSSLASHKPKVFNLSWDFFNVYLYYDLHSFKAIPSIPEQVLTVYLYIGSF